MLSIPALKGLIQSNLMAKSYNGHSFNGSELPTFALAIATGVVNTALTLTGQVTSPALIGVSTGTGIIFSGSGVGSGIRTAAIGFFGQEGPVLADVCDAIGNAVQAHFATASLLSNTNGPAIFTSFSGATNAMAGAIQAAAPNFIGSQWPNFAKAIATGVCQEIGSNGTGVLSGAAAPGAGSGVVIIS